MDALTRAYATLGVRPDCSRGELKRAYRALVKRWHPDRYAADPAGQAEAGRQLRLINTAMHLLERRLAGASGHPTQAPVPTTSPAASQSGPPSAESRPLSRAELDAIARACASDSPVDVAVAFISDVSLFVVGALCFVPQKGQFEVSMRDAIVGLACIGGGTMRLIWRRFKGGGSGRPTSGSG
jgi:hypothetical protein